jgi:hypothetical protein
MDPDVLDVRVRQKSTANGCDVDYEAVNLRRATATTTADQIRWCVKNGVATNYYIHFTNDPFSNNDIFVNQNPGKHKTCSNPQTPISSMTPGPYDYEIRYTTAAGSRCGDPKVILK